MQRTILRCEGICSIRRKVCVAGGWKGRRPDAVNQGRRVMWGIVLKVCRSERLGL